MLIGNRIREIRRFRGLSQRDVSGRSGLFPAYVSRIENNHTTPSLETLERFARALGVPLYTFFYDREKLLGRQPPEGMIQTKRDRLIPRRLLYLLGKMSERRRMLLLEMARKLSKRHNQSRVRLIPKRLGRFSA